MTKLSSSKEDVIVLDFERENVHYHNTKCTIGLDRPSPKLWSHEWIYPSSKQILKRDCMLSINNKTEANLSNKCMLDKRTKLLCHKIIKIEKGPLHMGWKIQT